MFVVCFGVCKLDAIEQTKVENRLVDDNVFQTKNLEMQQGFQTNNMKEMICAVDGRNPATVDR